MHPPLARIDLGCCLEPEDRPEGSSDALGGDAGWFINEMEWAPDSCLTYFTRLLVPSISIEPPYHTDARMTQMVQRAAAAWYPLTEHIGLEFGRFGAAAAALRDGEVYTEEEEGVAAEAESKEEL